MSDLSTLSIEELVAALPEAAAETARQDVASGKVGGVRSEAHERALALARELRGRIRVAETSAYRALVAIGYEGHSSLKWLRTEDEGEPKGVSPRDPGMVSIPFMTTDSFMRQCMKNNETPPNPTP